MRSGRRITEPLRRRAKIGIRHDFGDEAQPQPFRRIDLPRGKQHPHRLLEADLPGQPMHPAAQRHGADQRLGQAEARALRRDDHITGQRNLEPAAQRQAVDRRHDRLGAIEPLDQPGIAVGGIGPVIPFARRLEVGSGAKAPARAGDHADELVRIVGKCVERGFQLVMHVRVDGIEPFRAIERDGGYSLRPFDDDMLHYCSSSGRAVRPAMIAAIPPISKQPEISASAGCSDFSP